MTSCSCATALRAHAELSDVAQPYSHAMTSCSCPTTRCAQAGLGNAALPTNTVLDTTRLSGSVSTGSHGVGRGWGAVSDLVDSLTIVDGSGRPVVYNASLPYFNQARTTPWHAAVAPGVGTDRHVIQDPSCMVCSSRGPFFASSLHMPYGLFVVLLLVGRSTYL